MIPISLTINGIYSYRTKQHIDFTSLTGNHIFGIFGSVGSGKSTILEAISFALYGETERLNARDNRNYNLMNLKSDELFIEFEFKAGKNNKDIYKFVVEAKRDKKDFGTVKKYNRTAYKKQGSEWMPIDEDSSTSIIGLSYDNFRRTIILPQGKFQEFLQLGDNERTDMLKEIFNLGKYDLARKVDILEKENNGLLKNIEGQLQEIGDISEDVIEKESKTLKLHEVQQQKTQSVITSVEKEFNDYEDLKKIYNKIKKQEEEVDKLENQKDKYEEKELRLNEYEKCLRLFPDLFKQHQDLSLESSQLKNKIEKDEKQFKYLENDLSQNEKQYTGVKVRYDNKLELEHRCDELERLRKQLLLQDDVSKIEDKLKSESKKYKNIIIQIEEQQQSLAQLDKLLKQKKKELPDVKQLYEIRQWFVKKGDLEDGLKELKSKLGDENSEIKSLASDKNEILGTSIIQKYLSKSELKQPSEDIVELLLKGKNDVKKEIKHIEDEIKKLESTKILEQFANDLKDGKPCPLCGSKDHPDQFHSTGTIKIIKELEKKLEQSKVNIEEIDKLSRKIEKISSEEKSLLKTASKYKNDVDAKNELLDKHLSLFQWKNYSREDETKINSEIKKADKLVKEIELSEEKIESENDKLLGFQKQEKDLGKQISELEKSREKLNGGIQEIAKQARYYKESSFSQNEINKAIKDIKDDLNDIEKQYKKLTDSIAAIKESLHNLQGSLTIDKKNYEATLENLSRLDGKIKERIKEGKLSSREQIENILSQKLNPTVERKAITDYREKLQSSADMLKELISEKKGRIYDEKKHGKISLQLEENKKQLEQINKEIGRLEKSIKDLKIKIVKKEKLCKEQNTLENKADNLSTLRKLFRGNKFVSYVARVYLDSIVFMANQRFQPLTRQKLRLELDEKNSFLVRDYLNDGKTRNVKTLSGGQTFQASLALALALSDSIQKLNNTEENFFFMDEGFGTLDKDSLGVVFEALKSLRKENRVVGVISHVEELQQEIENCVRITLDEEKGSIISYN